MLITVLEHTGLSLSLRYVRRHYSRMWRVGSRFYLQASRQLRPLGLQGRRPVQKCCPESQYHCHLSTGESRRHHRGEQAPQWQQLSDAGNS